MPKRPSRSVVLVVPACAVVVAAAVAYLLLPARQTADVAVPPDRATPEEVVTAYLDALDAHDCATAETLTVAGAESIAAMCDDVASLEHVDVREHFMEHPQDSGHSAPDQVAHVPVDIDLSWRPFHNDGSMDDGATTWGYLLVRDSADSPWRIFDQGVG